MTIIGIMNFKPTAKFFIFKLIKYKVIMRNPVMIAQDVHVTLLRIFQSILFPILPNSDQLVKLLHRTNMEIRSVKNKFEENIISVR